MTDRIRLTAVVGVGALIAWLTGTGVVAAQDDCARYVRVRQTLDALVTQRQEIDRKLHGNLWSAERRRFEQERQTVVGKIQTVALEAAGLLKACDQRQPVEAVSEDALKRAYQMAQHFIDAQQCPDAVSFLTRCQQHPRAATAVIGGQQIGKAVTASLKQCQSSNPGHNEFGFRGKIAYIMQDNKDRLIDDRPYSADELAAIGGRSFGRDESTQAETALRPLSPRGAVLVRPPFVLVAGPGEFQLQAYEPKKFPPGDQGLGASGDAAQQALEYVYARVVAPVSDKLERELFTNIQRRSLIPVYLVGGKLDEPGLQEFVRYCQTVHLRSCGVRLGYYLPLDNSVMVWLSSGGGTLAHEMVHALMEEHFPSAPPWLSEGLASLQEAFGPGVTPLDNYRLIYVRTAMDRFGRLIAVDRLLALTGADFDAGDAAPLNAALARYFVFYLTERGKFARVYAEIRKLTDRSPAAQLRVLEAELGQSARVIQADWQRWVAGRAEPVDWQAFRSELQEAVRQMPPPRWTHP